MPLILQIKLSATLECALTLMLDKLMLLPMLCLEGLIALQRWTTSLMLMFANNDAKKSFIYK